MGNFEFQRLTNFISLKVFYSLQGYLEGLRRVHYIQSGSNRLLLLTKNLAL